MNEVAAPPETLPYLFWAYTIIWAILVAYIFSLGRRLARLEKSMTTKE